MTKARKILIALMLAIAILADLFTIAAIGNAKTLGEAAIMAKDDALAIFFGMAIAIIATLIGTIALLTAKSRAKIFKAGAEHGAALERDIQAGEAIDRQLQARAEHEAKLASNPD